MEQIAAALYRGRAWDRARAELSSGRLSMFAVAVSTGCLILGGFTQSVVLMTTSVLVLLTAVIYAIAWVQRAHESPLLRCVSLLPIALVAPVVFGFGARRLRVTA